MYSFHVILSVLFMQQITYFENSPDIGKGVKGSLFRHSQFWEYICANQFILNTIKNGYVVPFVTTPPPMKFKNNKSAINNELFVDKSISDLLESGCVQDLSSSALLVWPKTKRLVKRSERIKSLCRKKKSQV
jgi:hypothetical protein